MGGKKKVKKNCNKDKSGVSLSKLSNLVLGNSLDYN